MGKSYRGKSERPIGFSDKALRKRKRKNKKRQRKGKGSRHE